MTLTKEIVTNYIQEYASRCSIHGFQYFFEKKRTMFERFLWVSIFTLSISTCLFVVHGSYQQWGENAVVVTVSSRLTPIYKIPFPAVTICPVSRIPKFNCSRYRNDTNAFWFAYHLCDKRALVGSILYECEVAYTIPPHKDEDFFDFMDEVKSDFDVDQCIFDDTDCNLENNFVPVITEEGICSSFNILDREAIFKTDVQHYKSFHKSDQNGTLGFFMNNSYKQFVPGRHHGLNFGILTEQKEIDNCVQTFSGYKIFIHSPSSLPSSYNFVLSLDQSEIAILKPTVTVASAGIQKYSVESRKCFWEDERTLQFFQIYTKTNCEVECWANYTLALCGCAHFSSPRHQGTRLCIGPQLEQCARTAKDLATSDTTASQMENDDKSAEIRDFLEMRNINSNIPHCNCLSTCSDVDYRAEISHHNLDSVAWYKSRAFGVANINYTAASFTRISHLTLFFDQHEVFTYERKEFYGPLEFMANFGGLLGLFCGFSLLSLVEMLYFLSVRIICNRFLNGPFTTYRASSVVQEE